jgi:YggT family protein
MFIIGYFLGALATVIHYVLTFYMFIILARAILSWVSPDPYNPIVRFIHNVTEPILYPIRTKFPVGFGGIDLSPMIVFLVIIFLKQFLVNTLIRISAKFI